MSAIKNLSLKELAVYVSTHLHRQGIPVTLVGGGCVSIYTHNQYQTGDLDFIERHYTPRTELRAALALIGFHEKGKERYFVHPDTKYFLEFPSGPLALALGRQPVTTLHQVETAQGTLSLLTATDCIKDRLCAYFYWNDRQSLTQALNVAQAHAFDLDDIKRWAEQEKQLEKFAVFEAAVLKAGEGG